MFLGRPESRDACRSVTARPRHRPAIAQGRTLENFRTRQVPSWNIRGLRGGLCCDLAEAHQTHDIFRDPRMIGRRIHRRCRVARFDQDILDDYAAHRPLAHHSKQVSDSAQTHRRIVGDEKAVICRYRTKGYGRDPSSY